MAPKTQTEYRVTIHDNDGILLNAGVFLNEVDADKFARNAGVGEGYKVQKFTEVNTVDEVDWIDIKMEKWAHDAREYYPEDDD